MALADRYHEIMTLRNEAFHKYGVRQATGLFSPPSRISWPALTLNTPHVPALRIGPMYFGDNPPIKSIAEARLMAMGSPVSILEIGPGKGTLSNYFLKKHPEHIRAYYGLERDPHVMGPYTRIADVSEINEELHLLIASEVAEHMTADHFFYDLLLPAKSKLSSGGALVMGVPNPLSAKGIFLDFTHVQAYPWYDLYAILRLAFKKVEVYRTFYLWSMQRLATLLPRIALSKLMELDWCDGIACVASEPFVD